MKGGSFTQVQIRDLIQSTSVLAVGSVFMNWHSEGTERVRKWIKAFRGVQRTHGFWMALTCFFVALIILDEEKVRRAYARAEVVDD